MDKVRLIQAKQDAVTITHQPDGSLCSKSQVDDYIHCGNKLELFSLLRFIVNTYEETTKKLSATVLPRAGPGRPRNRRVPYLN